MNDTASYRKGNKSPSPIAIMRQFYKDNSVRRHKPKALSNLYEPTHENKTSSTEKFTRLLQRASDKESSMTERQTGTNTLTCRQTKMDKRKDKMRDLILKAKEQNANKQHFKNTYTKFHPFFNAHPGIKRILSPKGLLPAPSQAMFPASKVHSKTMTNLFKEMQLAKDTLRQNRQEKKKRLDCIRHDWLVENLHRNFEEKERMVGQRRTRDNLEMTKENIFPQTVIRC